MQAGRLCMKLQQKHRTDPWRQNDNEEILVSQKRCLVRDWQGNRLGKFLSVKVHNATQTAQRDNYFSIIQFLTAPQRKEWTHRQEKTSNQAYLPDCSENVNLTVETRLKIWISVSLEGSRMIIKNIASDIRLHPRRNWGDWLHNVKILKNKALRESPRPCENGPCENGPCLSSPSRNSTSLLSVRNGFQTVSPSLQMIHDWGMDDRF